MDILGKDVLFIIFSYLKFSDLKSLRISNRQWKKIITSFPFYGCILNWGRNLLSASWLHKEQIIYATKWCIEEKEYTLLYKLVSKDTIEEPRFRADIASLCATRQGDELALNVIATHRPPPCEVLIKMVMEASRGGHFQLWEKIFEAIQGIRSFKDQYLVAAPYQEVLDRTIFIKWVNAACECPNEQDALNQLDRLRSCEFFTSRFEIDGDGYQTTFTHSSLCRIAERRHNCDIWNKICGFSHFDIIETYACACRGGWLRLFQIVDAEVTIDSFIQKEMVYYAAIGGNSEIFDVLVSRLTKSFSFSQQDLLNIFFAAMENGNIHLLEKYVHMFKGINTLGPNYLTKQNVKSVAYTLYKMGIIKTEISCWNLGILAPLEILDFLRENDSLLYMPVIKGAFWNARRDIVEKYLHHLCQEQIQELIQYIECHFLSYCNGGAALFECNGDTLVHLGKEIWKQDKLEGALMSLLEYIRIKSVE